MFQSYADENHSLGHVLPHVYLSMDDFWRQCFAPPSVSGTSTSTTDGAATRSRSLGLALLAVAVAFAVL